MKRSGTYPCDLSTICEKEYTACCSIVDEGKPKSEDHKRSDRERHCDYDEGKRIEGIEVVIRWFEVVMRWFEVLMR